VWGKPCIIGPYNHQCDIISEQLKNIGGLMQVQSYQELLTITYSLLNNLSQCNKMGKNNLNWVINQEDQISQTLLKFNNLINS
jgi:3-deoxy-D-manno-octulosonic-acid transferase